VALTLEKRLEVTRDILRMVQGAMASIAQVEGLLNVFELPLEDFEARIFVLARLAELARELSIKTYRSEEHRLHVVEAIQNSLDRYIEKEDVVVNEVP
jgi:7,8-dihydro-6-hydroxymethylpterin-pyrophosphokinase